MKRVVFLDAAREEMMEAAEYYEGKAAGLGVDFLDEVEHAVHRALQFPKAATSPSSRCVKSAREDAK